MKMDDLGVPLIFGNIHILYFSLVAMRAGHFPGRCCVSCVTHDFYPG